MNPEEPKNNVSSLEEAKKRKQTWRRVAKSKWFIPGLYLTLAALLLGTAWFLRDNESTTTTVKPTQDTILPVEKSPTAEQMIHPIAKDSEASKTTDFYQENATSQQKESALVKYANTYWPHLGFDFARKDKKSFNVVAVMDGKVVKVDRNPILGELVEIQHANGLVSVYISLDDVKVQLGQNVRQGDILAKAGQNQFEQEQGNHLHFEIRKDDQAVNPSQYLKSE